MAARFAPLDLPVVLHDIPHKYSQRITLFDGEGKFTVRPYIPFQCYSGVVEKKAIPLALSVWFPTHQVYQANQALIPTL